MPASCCAYAPTCLLLTSASSKLGWGAKRGMSHHADPPVPIPVGPTHFVEDCTSWFAGTRAVKQACSAEHAGKLHRAV